MSGGEDGLERAGVRPDSWRRRGVDVLVAAPALVLLAPVLALVAIAVRLDSPGPAVFRQTRVGRDGVPFRILKFRTMVADAERLGPAVSFGADPRVTRVGALLRRTKIDELPQLVNVLRGQMTLVGPRPEVPSMVAHYRDDERAVLLVRPGVTGPGQIAFSADCAATRTTADADAVYVERVLHPKLRADLDYLRGRSWRRDVTIVAATAGLLLGAVSPGVQTR